MTGDDPKFPPFGPVSGFFFSSSLFFSVPPGLDVCLVYLQSPFVAVITGASRGIGKAAAQVFARAGATGLILTARNPAPLEETKKRSEAVAKSPDLKISLVLMESGSEADTKRLVDVVKSEHGRLDLLMHNAGLVSTDPSAFSLFGDVRSDQPRVTMECNYFGRFLTMQAFLPLLLESPGGSKVVINITSICSHLTAFGPMCFNISDMASNRLTEIVALRYADQGLLCYSVHPGEVPTTLPIGAPPALLEISKDDPALCGSVCLWLVRKKPVWLSGRYISSEWDLDELEAKREEIVRGDKLKARMLV